MPQRYDDHVSPDAEVWRVEDLDMLACDEESGWWVATDVADVEAVLTSPAVRVRPLDAIVPAALGCGRAAAVFGRLIRMNDGGERVVVKESIVAALEDVGGEDVRAASEVVAAWLLAGDPMLDGWFLDRWIEAFPIGVVATLVGFDPAMLDLAVAHARTLATCFGPNPPTGERALADEAAAVLTQLVLDAAVLDADGASPRHIAGSVLAAVGPQRRDDAVANLVGLFFQAHDATAGMLGNAIAGDAAGAVLNTRRYVAERVVLAGRTVDPGDCILVEIASADMPFGHGSHSCPAGRLAGMIVECGIELLPDAALAHAIPVGYRPLPNIRVSVFGQPGPSGCASS